MADKLIDVVVAGCQDALRDSVRRLALDFEQRLAAAPHEQAKLECHSEFQVGLRRAMEAHAAALELVTTAMKSARKPDKKARKKDKGKGKDKDKSKSDKKKDD